MALLPFVNTGPAPIRMLSKIVDVTVAMIGATMVLLVFANVVMHVLKKDIALTTEFCEFLMVWATFLGGAAASRRGAHMTITEFIDKLAAKPRRYADALIQLFCLVILALLIGYGVSIVNHNWGNLLTVLGWPMAWHYMSLPVGATVSFIFVAFDLIEILRGKSREERYGE